MKLFRILASCAAVTALVLAAACSSGGGSSPVLTPPTNNPGPGATNTPPPQNETISSPPISVSSSTIRASENFDNGSESWYNSGVTAWSPAAGDTSIGANGGNSIDGVGCTQMGEPAGSTQMHVHAFVGLYVNGVEEAIPSAVGMKAPTQPTSSSEKNDNYAVLTAQCFYHLHTHDYSGLIHIEDTSLAQSFTKMPSYATLKTLFDVWGVPLNASAVASFKGSVAMYSGTPTSKNANNEDVVGAYTPFNGNLTTISLGHHVAIWIVVGTPPPTGLPKVEFDIED